jgi:glycosyltransferase involved in cell wall biosynthesis
MLLPAFAAFGRVVCCGRSSRASFPWLYRLVAGRRLVVVCNGVDLRRVDAVWQPMAANGWVRERPLQLITVGQLCTRKNQVTVVRALAHARHKDVCLQVVGDGPDRRALENLVQELDLSSRVEFTGRLERDDVLRALWRADACIAMSRGEGLPIAVLEAMSCHCPVILSDIPGHREVRDGRTDLVPLVPPDDFRALARAIDAWAGMPLDVLRAWGADCRCHVERRYPLHKTLDRLDGVLEQLSPTFSPEWEVFIRCLRRKHRRRKVA